MQFYNQGFCKAGPGCMFDHPDVDCETHIRGKSCRANIVTVKTAVLEEWNACFLNNKLY